MTNTPPQPTESQGELRGKIGGKEVIDWINSPVQEEWQERVMSDFEDAFHPSLIRNLAQAKTSLSLKDFYILQAWWSLEFSKMESFISAQRQQAAEEVLDMLGTGHDLFLEWRFYVKTQYDNPEKETRVIDSFEYWLDRKINLIKFKIKNG